MPGRLPSPSGHPPTRTVQSANNSTINTSVDANIDDDDNSTASDFIKHSSSSPSPSSPNGASYKSKTSTSSVPHVNTSSSTMSHRVEQSIRPRCVLLSFRDPLFPSFVNSDLSSFLHLATTPTVTMSLTTTLPINTLPHRL